MKVLRRHAEAWAKEMLAVSPVVVIQGARQVGKSTLAALLSEPGSTSTTMDDEVTRAYVHDDPVGFLRSAGEGRLVIDEIQRCPELVLPLKAEVDRDRRPGRFLLTGSANLLRVPAAEDSLAGRAMTLRLHPFSQGELIGREDDWVGAVVEGSVAERATGRRSDVIERLVRGGYPPVQTMTPRLRSGWLREYADRLVERDAADIAAAQVPLLRRLLQLLAAAPGSEVVWERLAEALGVARNTVSRYLDILESLFLVYRLPSWSRNLTARQTARAKCYLTDSGLACAVGGLTAEHLGSMHGADHLGPLLENFVVSELVRQQGWSAIEYQLSHYRDRAGAEVDIVIETPRGIIGVEVKSAVAASAHHFKHLAGLRDKLGNEFLAGVVLTTETGQRAGDRLWALPVETLWG